MFSYPKIIQEDYFFLKRDIVENLPPKPPEKASPEFQSFIMKCLTKDYKVRHTAEELLNDPFIASVNEKDGDQIIINNFKKIEIGLPTFWVLLFNIFMPKENFKTFSQYSIKSAINTILYNIIN